MGKKQQIQFFDFFFLIFATLSLGPEQASAY